MREMECQDRQQGQQAGRPFGEEGEAEGRPHGVDPARRAAAETRLRITEHGQDLGRREHGVGVHRVRREEGVGRCDEDQRRQPGAFGNEQPPETEHHQCAEHESQRHRQAHGPLVSTEGFHAGRHRPIGQRRFGEVERGGVPVQGDRVARLQHLQGHVAVAPFVRIPQSAAALESEGHQGREQENGEQGAAVQGFDHAAGSRRNAARIPAAPRRPQTTGGHDLRHCAFRHVRPRRDLREPERVPDPP